MLFDNDIVHYRVNRILVCRLDIEHEYIRWDHRLQQVCRQLVERKMSKERKLMEEYRKEKNRRHKIRMEKCRRNNCRMEKYRKEKFDTGRILKLKIMEKRERDREVVIN